MTTEQRLETLASRAPRDRFPARSARILVTGFSVASILGLASAIRAATPEIIATPEASGLDVGPVQSLELLLPTGAPSAPVDAPATPLIPTVAGTDAVAQATQPQSSTARQVTTSPVPGAQATSEAVPMQPTASAAVPAAAVSQQFSAQPDADAAPTQPPSDPTPVQASPAQPLPSSTIPELAPATPAPRRVVVGAPTAPPPSQPSSGTSSGSR